jgi:hypothetical protein
VRENNSGSENSAVQVSPRLRVRVISQVKRNYELDVEEESLSPCEGLKCDLEDFLHV